MAVIKTRCISGLQSLDFDIAVGGLSFFTNAGVQRTGKTEVKCAVMDTVSIFPGKYIKELLLPSTAGSSVSKNAFIYRNRI